jgi:GntR family transcriptional repressor for pyruvate dehydrogenase complex
MFEDIGRGRLHERVVEAITERILSGDLEPGSVLPTEPELCELFGVSRTVIRDAMKMLQGRGLVEVMQGRGTMVSTKIAEFSSDILVMALQQRQTTLVELLEVRRILEVEIAGLAAERATGADLREMEQALDLMRSHPGEAPGYVDADLTFHNALTRAAHNMVMDLILRPVTQLLRHSREISFRGPERVGNTIAAHETILRAVAAGDRQAAREAMRRHLDETAADLREALGEAAMRHPPQSNG